MTGEGPRERLRKQQLGKRQLGADDGARPVARLAERQDIAPGTAEELVVELLRAQRPYRLPLGRRQRVGALLAQRQRRRRASPWVLRPAVILATIVICGGAFASARILGWPRWIVAGYERLVAVAPESAGPPLERAPAGARRPIARAPVVERPERQAAASPAVAPPAAPASVSGVPRAALAVSPPSRRHEPGRAPGGGKRAFEEDASPVLAALRALRRAHDPVRARALLDAYLREHPDGTLAEEALAITIEAAVAHHDADAAALAARYLKRYPSGPFRPLARKALAQPVGP